MKKTTLCLTPQLRRARMDMAQRTKRLRAPIVRDALPAYIAAAPSPRLRSLGVVDDSEVSGTTSEAYLHVESAAVDYTRHIRRLCGCQPA